MDLFWTIALPNSTTSMACQAPVKSVKYLTSGSATARAFSHDQQDRVSQHKRSNGAWLQTYLPLVQVTLLFASQVVEHEMAGYCGIGWRERF